MEIIPTENHMININKVSSKESISPIPLTINNILKDPKKKLTKINPFRKISKNKKRKQSHSLSKSSQVPAKVTS